MNTTLLPASPMAAVLLRPAAVTTATTRLIRAPRLLFHRLRFLLPLLLLLAASWQVPAQWTQVANTGPSPRYYSAMAEAPGLGQTILFGGLTGANFSAGQGDTWNWNGSAWQALPPAAPQPSARSTHGMAYLANGATHQVVLFGGVNTGSATLGDTWVWEGTAWRLITGPMPPTRFMMGMASETARGRVLLFGGRTGATAQSDTWSFNGTAWTQHSVTGPSARGEHAMAYDSGRDRVVLFGGRLPGQPANNETWEWEGAVPRWTLKSTNGPAARTLHTLTYHNGRIVLYGGIDPVSNLVFWDTWEWDGAQWSLVSLICPSPARFAHASAAGTPAGHPLVFGGALQTLLNDTWRYTGGVITTQPASQTVEVGQPATFSLQISGGPATYQWQRDCGAGYTSIPDATNSNYTVTAASTNDACLYRCLAIVGACTSLSAGAQLTVLPAGSFPAITQQPQSQSASPGSIVTFTVNATGAVPLTYQWYFNGGVLAGSTTNAATVGPVGSQHVGSYSVVVANPLGSVTSSPALLSLSSNACIPAPAGLVAWWPFDEATGAPVVDDIAGAVSNQGTPVQSPIGSSPLAPSSVTAVVGTGLCFWGVHLSAVGPRCGGVDATTGAPPQTWA